MKRHLIDAGILDHHLDQDVITESDVGRDRTNGPGMIDVCQIWPCRNGIRSPDKITGAVFLPDLAGSDSLIRSDVTDQ